MSQHAKPTPSLKQRLAMTLGGLTAISLTVTGLVALSVPAAQAVGCDPTATTIPTAPATAGFGGGTGQLATPWLICSRAQLEGIDNNSATLDGNYLLAADLDLGGSAAPWTPISSIFTGVFDGQFFGITNIFVSGSEVRQGLFATLGSTSEVKNLRLSGEVVSTQTLANVQAANSATTAYRHGLLAGSALNATIKNIFISAVKLSGPVRYGGGLIGYFDTSSANQVVIRGVDIDPDVVTGMATYNGGALGFVTGSNIKRVSTSGTLGVGSTSNNSGNNRGGIAGDIRNSSLDQADSAVSIQGADPNSIAGGLAGQASGVTLSNSRYIGSLADDLYVGGAMGGNYSSTTHSTSLVVSQVPALSSTNQPFSGANPATNSDSTFFDLSVYGATPPFTSGTSYNGAVAKTTAELKSLANYTSNLAEGDRWSIKEALTEDVTINWSLTDTTDPIWKIAPNSYPELVWLDFFDNQFVQLSYGPADTTVYPGQYYLADATIPQGSEVPDYSKVSGPSGVSVDPYHGTISAPQGLTAGSSFIVQVRATQQSRGLNATVYRQVKVSNGFFPSTQSAVDLSEGPEAGETIWASAFEKHLSTNLTTNNTALDEYAYRITTSENDEDTIVDTQLFGLSDYTALTAAEQQAWYDSMQSPYYFVWRAFVCVENSNGPIFSQPSNMNVDYTSLQDIFIGTTIDQDDNADLRKVESTLNGSQPKTLTVVGETNINVRGTWESNKVVKGITSVSATCSAPATFEALDIVDENGLAINQKSLDTTSIYVDVQGTAVELDPEGLTIGVTGVVSNRFNEALWGITTIQSNAALASPAGSSTPYVGPKVTKVEGSTPGNQTTVRGDTLSTVSKVEIDGIAIEIKNASDNSFSFTLPATLKPGVKDLKITSSFGVLTVQAALTVLGSVETTLNTRGQWTKLQPSGTEVKLYAKEPVGRGKLQFFQNGREVAWIRAVDESDHKLSRASGAAYFVRTLALRPGKNRFEIRLDGLRVWRATYIPKG